MSRSAFSDVKLSLNSNALDQRLVAPSSPMEAVGAITPPPTRALADSHVSLHQDTHSRALADSDTRTIAGSNARLHEGSHAGERAPDHEYSNTAGRSGAPPTSQIRSSDRRATRPVERYSHDLFKDQVRWINRLKLDVEEQEGIRLTGNAIVQLALDLLRDDFDRHSSESALVRVLVRGHDWREAGERRLVPTEEGST